MSFTLLCEAEVVWACDAKRATLCRKEGDGNESTGRRKRGRPERRRLDRVRDDIRKKGVSGRKCMTELHAAIYRHTLTPHKSGTKVKKIISLH